MKTILSIEKPLILYNQDYAFPAAMMSSEKSFQNWLYSNAIQLYYINDRKNFNLSYFYLGIDPNPLAVIPLLRCQSIDLKVVKGSGITAISFVRDMINNGYYITCLLNEYYVKCRQAYNTRKFEHGNMIYGFDDEKHQIFLAGFNEYLQFSNTSISYENFEKAFLEIGRESDYGCCFKRNKTIYKFDRKLVRELLFDFISSKNTSERYRMVQNPLENCYWGIEACQHILDNGNIRIDYRYFYTVYEYMCLMQKRIPHLFDNEKTKVYFIEKTERIKLDFYSLLLAVIKFNMNGKSREKIDKIRKRLSEMLILQKEILTELYNCI